MKKRLVKKSAMPKAVESSSALFDDALPQRFIDMTSAEGLKAPVRLHVGGTPALSPFVVKLSREEELVSPLSAPVNDPIQALAQSFIIEHDDVSDEAPLMVAHTDRDGLTLALDDLREQLREPEMALPAVPETAPVARRASEKKAAVEDLWADTEPVDLLQAFTPSVTATVAVEQKSEEVALPVRFEPTAMVIVEEPVAYIEHPRRSRVVLVGWQRALASFVGLAFAAVLPLHALQVMADVRTDGGAIEAESRAALDTFLRGTTSLSGEDFGTASTDFSQAARGFAEAQASLDDLHSGVTALAGVIPQTSRTMDSVRGLVTAGEELAETASIMSSAASDLSDREALDLTTKLNLLGAYVENALPHASAAAVALRQVDPEAVPGEYAAQVQELKVRTPQMVESMGEFLRFLDTLSVILGGEGKMRYLAAFQNNTELRPTGGFVGSFAEIDVEHGEVARLFVPGGGSYDVQGQLKAFVAAPGPLQLLKARWEFQDANWFPDFATSAKKMRWFYGEAGGPTSDGVIAINATFVAELLRVLGPVEMPQYGRTFDAENFIFETQKIVELEYDPAVNTPKAIIGELAPILLERVQEADVSTLMAVVDLVAKGLEEKDILLNFRDNDLQGMIDELGWSGGLKQTDGDYLMVVNTNLGGGKTDGVIDQKVDVQVEIGEDGSVENTVTITKTHRGMKNALFTGSNNVDYLRLYVPEGSELMSAQGFEMPPDALFEISEIPLDVDKDLALHMQNVDRDEASGTDIWNEDGKTVFGNWMQTASGETETVSFTYRLPFKVVESTEQGIVAMTQDLFGKADIGAYTLLIQKQPGVMHRETLVTIEADPSLQPLWSSVGDANVLTAAVANDTDHFVGWLFERE